MPALRVCESKPLTLLGFRLSHSQAQARLLMVRSPLILLPMLTPIESRKVKEQSPNNNASKQRSQKIVPASQAKTAVNDTAQGYYPKPKSVSKALPH